MSSSTREIDDLVARAARQMTSQPNGHDMAVLYDIATAAFDLGVLANRAPLPGYHRAD